MFGLINYPISILESDVSDGLGPGQGPGLDIGGLETAKQI